MPEGELSQDDIDSLLGMEGGESEATAAGAEAQAAAVEEPEGAAPSAEPGLPGQSIEAGGEVSPGRAKEAFELIRDVPLRVKIELGRSKMYVDDILKLGSGSVVELEKLAGDPLDILVNDRLVARGELIVLDDYFCVRVTEIISADKRREREA